MKSGGYFDVTSWTKLQQEKELEMNAPDFWSDQKRAQKISKEINFLKEQFAKNNKLIEIQEEIETYLLLLEEEFNENLFHEAIDYLNQVRDSVNDIEVYYLLNGKHDRNDAILSIHPGAGGTESQDWAEMLTRMYTRWAESNDLKIQVVDLLPGDEAGIKSVTMEIMGEHAFGYLKSEIGVHRLVRISPFNAQGKRQTSFASVFVYPLLDEETEIDIDPSEIRIDTYRASGKGGQGVNTTDSAVRITHLPTNIVVQCQNERSQNVNRQEAMKILRSRLSQYFEEEKEKEKRKLENLKTDIGWGNQIRSYVFHPYQMVKDHRTSFETGNTSSVMDGNLNQFINAYLKYQAEKNLVNKDNGNVI